MKIRRWSQGGFLGGLQQLFKNIYIWLARTNIRMDIFASVPGLFNISEEIKSINILY